MPTNPLVLPDLPAGLSQPSLRALQHAGITRLDQIPKFTEKELLKLHGLGPKTIRILRPALKAIGKSFAKESKSIK
jgi:predicted flap endonuclease-1-like 5' DNA nuclease